MTITVLMALVSVIALTTSVIICCKKPRSKLKVETNPVYYSSTSAAEVLADPMYEEVPTIIKKEMDTEPNEAYNPVSVELNEAYHTCLSPVLVT